jgi:hypothetical protein
MAKHALCIGINDYPGTDSDLRGCINDANDWAAMLAARGFEVEKLLDRQATGKGIRAAITSAVTKAKSGDIVFIQYSGHGSYVPDVDGDEPDGTDECICPYDVKTKGPITDDELFDLYNGRTSGVRLVIASDSCHSGSVARFAPITTPPTIAGRNAPQRKVKFLPPSTFLPQDEASTLGLRRAIRTTSPPGRYAGLLMAGCQDVEVSWDASFQGRPNGAFSFVALQALKDVSDSATYRDWFKAIRKVLPSQQYNQTPNLYGSSNMKSWRVLE